MALQPRNRETTQWAHAVSDALMIRQRAALNLTGDDRHRRRVTERMVADELCDALPALQSVQVYWWFDGVDVPRTQAQYDAFIQALPPANEPAFHAIWQRALASLANTPPPPVEFVRGTPDQNAAAHARAAPGNRMAASPAHSRGLRQGAAEVDDDVFDAPRVQHGRHHQFNYNFLDPNTLEFISNRTTNLHEFLRVNRLLSRWGGPALSTEMGFDSNVMHDYENKARHPKHDTLRKMQGLLFNDTEAGKEKRLKLEDLVIRDKVTAGNHCVNELNYRGYIQHTKDLPRAFWYATLTAFCFPKAWAARNDKPRWADMLLEPGCQGEFIRAVRLHLNMRQVDLADAINAMEPVGLSRNIISQVENSNKISLSEHQYMAVLRFFELHNRAAVPRGATPFFDMQLARQRFDEWFRQAEDIARDERGPARDDEDVIPYGDETPGIVLGAPAAPAVPPRPQVDAATIGPIRPPVNRNLSLYNDEPCVPRRHHLFLHHPAHAIYDKMDRTLLPTIAAESKNFSEFVLVNRLIADKRRNTDLPEGLKSSDFKNIENGGSFPSLEKLTLISRWLFPDGSPNMEANRTKLEQLFIENKIAIAAGAMAAGDNKAMNQNLDNLPRAYWDQVFMRLDNPDAWQKQQNPPAWKDAVMEITSRGLYVKAFRFMHDKSAQELVEGLPDLKNRISPIETGNHLYPADTTLYTDQLLPRIQEINAQDPNRRQDITYVKPAYQTLAAQPTHAPWPRSAFRLPYNTRDGDLPPH